MALPDPEAVKECCEAIPGWEQDIAESEPLLAYLQEHGCTRGEALILLWLNKIHATLVEREDDDE